MPMVINIQGDDEEIARWIWNNLVPESGQSLTVQGELLRAIERLRWEAQENGNINWDRGFEMFIDFLHENLVEKSIVSEEVKKSIESDLRRLRDFLPVEDFEEDGQADRLPYVDDDLYDRLTLQVVDFCRLNPVVISRKVDKNQGR